MSQIMRPKGLRRWLTGIGTLLAATPGLAVDDRPIDLTARYSVVGVIAGANGSGGAIGIAVLKDQETDRSLTLSIGDKLPADETFRVKAMERRQVTVTNGDKDLVLEVLQERRDQDPTTMPNFAERFYRINQFGPSHEGELTDSWNPVDNAYGDRPEDRPQIWPRPVPQGQNRMVINGVAVDPWTGVPLGNDEPTYEVNGDRWQAVGRNANPPADDGFAGRRYQPLDTEPAEDPLSNNQVIYEPVPQTREEFIPGEGWVDVPVVQEPADDSPRTTQDEANENDDESYDEAQYYGE